MSSAQGVRVFELVEGLGVLHWIMYVILIFAHILLVSIVVTYTVDSKVCKVMDKIPVTAFTGWYHIPMYILELCYLGAALYFGYMWRWDLFMLVHLAYLATIPIIQRVTKRRRKQYQEQEAKATSDNIPED